MRTTYHLGAKHIDAICHLQKLAYSHSLRRTVRNRRIDDIISCWAEESFRSHVETIRCVVAGTDIPDRPIVHVAELSLGQIGKVRAQGVGAAADDFGAQCGHVACEGDPSGILRGLTLRRETSLLRLAAITGCHLSSFLIPGRLYQRRPILLSHRPCSIEGVEHPCGIQKGGVLKLAIYIDLIRVIDQWRVEERDRIGYFHLVSSHSRRARA